MKRDNYGNIIWDSYQEMQDYHAKQYKLTPRATKGIYLQNNPVKGCWIDGYLANKIVIDGNTIIDTFDTTDIQSYVSNAVLKDGYSIREYSGRITTTVTGGTFPDNETQIAYITINNWSGFVYIRSSVNTNITHRGMLVAGSYNSIIDLPNYVNLHLYYDKNKKRYVTQANDSIIESEVMREGYGMFNRRFDTAPYSQTGIENEKLKLSSGINGSSWDIVTPT